MRIHHAWLMLMLLFPAWGHAETASKAGGDTSASSTTAKPESLPTEKPVAAYSPEQIAALRAAEGRLLQLFTKENGKPANVVVFRPMDFTTWNFTDQIAKTIRDDIVRNGQFKISVEHYTLKSLTLEEFRRAMAEYDADVLITTVIKPDNFYIYLYDRRTPYFIYAHNEPVPQQVQEQMTGEIADYYAKVIERRVLYRYMQQQYFQLPRDESAPVLSSELPRWIASNESLALVNRDLESRFYVGLGMGTAFTTGDSTGYWNSNVLSGEVGYRPSKHSRWYLEGAFEAFSYNAIIGSAKYMITSKDSPFRFLLGFGLSELMQQKSINRDRTLGLAAGGIFGVPSASVLVPILDCYFKLESRLYFGIGTPGYALSIHPGLVIPF